MDLHPLYWHWLAFGMILIITELFIPSFTVFWFGLAALRSISASANSKVVVLPADLPAAVRGIIGALKP
jgi:membrane protein implicated in regulation of membrane protease activity